MTKVYDCTAKVISPVHIGSGDSYGALEYINGELKINGELTDVFNIIDINKYYLSLDDDKRDRFLHAISQPNFSLTEFDNKISKEYRKYWAINKCNKNPKPDQEIIENIKTLNKPYIPGTSLKGAIRTAILYNTLSLEDIPDFVDASINRGNKGYYLNKRGYDNYVNRIFSSNNRKAPQTSIMKFLQVSDSSSVQRPAIYDVLVVMATDSKSNQFYRGGVRSFLEVLRPNHNLDFSMINSYDKQIYSDLNLYDKAELIDINNIKSAIYNFSKAYIEHEISFAEEYGIKYLLNFYKKNKKLNQPDSPLMKIGAGSGLLGTTIGLKILEYDDYEFDNYMDKVSGTFINSYDFCFPKSRKVTSKGGYPLGWVKLSFKERSDE